MWDYEGCRQACIDEYYKCIFLFPYVGLASLCVGAHYRTPQRGLSIPLCGILWGTPQHPHPTLSPLSIPLCGISMTLTLNEVSGVVILSIPLCGIMKTILWFKFSKALIPTFYSLMWDLAKEARHISKAATGAVPFYSLMWDF